MKPNAEIVSVIGEEARAAVDALGPAVGAVEKKLATITGGGREELNLLSVAKEGLTTHSGVPRETKSIGHDFDFPPVDEFTIAHVAKLLGRPVPSPYVRPSISIGIPHLADHGRLPDGVHFASWQEVMDRFAFNDRRLELSHGLLGAAHDLRDNLYVDNHMGGSYLSEKPFPGDFDFAYATGKRGTFPLFRELPIFRNRELMKLAYGGESMPDFADFFTYNKYITSRIGLVKLDMTTLPPRPTEKSAGLEFMERFGGKKLFQKVLGFTTTEQPFPSTDGRVMSSTLVRKGSDEKIDRFVEEIRQSMGETEK